MAINIREVQKLISSVGQLLEIYSSQIVIEEDDSSRLEIALEELRIIYARLDDSIATVRVRILTFLAAGLALMSYLYGGGDLFIPAEPYGKVFYFLGLGLVIASLSFLLQAIRPNSWAVPIETKMNKLNRYKTKHALLELLCEEYIESMIINVSVYEKKCQLYISGFGLLLCGGILLLVIKSIGG